MRTRRGRARRLAANPVAHLGPDARDAVRRWRRALGCAPVRPLRGDAGHLSLREPKLARLSRLA
eukprot:3552168-Pyramimonas_sp.AAC.1